ncbi:19898_t:CDS:2, partial [Gigaspora rosea]
LAVQGVLESSFSSVDPDVRSGFEDLKQSASLDETYSSFRIGTHRSTSSCLDR